MSLFTMAKKSTISPIPADPSSASASATDLAPPVPPKRPGTSGTELLLTTNRRTASAQYLAAQRAETAYKARKRSANARVHHTEATSHFRLAGHHFKEGIKSMGACVGAVPWMVREWREGKREKGERREVERLEEKKKKLEERIRVQEARDMGEREKGDAGIVEA